MNRRTLILLLGAISVGVLYAGDTAFRSFIEEPTQRYEGQLKALESELGDAGVSQVQGRRLVKDLEDYAERSLPFDPALARSRYQDWLLKLVEQNRMVSASINADSPRPIEVRSRTSRSKRRLIGHRLTYTIRARTTLSDFTNFLYEFNRSGQLHKIKDFSLNPLSDGSQLDLSLSIEALALQATEREDGLSDWVRDETVYPKRDVYNDWVQRNLFARGFSKVLAEVRLTAITTDRAGNVQAWLIAGNSGQTQKLTIGEALVLPLHSIRIVQIESGRVQLSVNEQEVWLSLGETLADVISGDTDTDSVEVQEAS